MKKEFNYKELLDVAEIKPGMTIDLIVDVFNMFKYCMKTDMFFESNHLINSLQDILGNEGTILIRSFTWDFCHNKGFDIKKSSSQSGALGNIALNRNDFKRTKHPIYNWMVWGRNSDYLCSLDNKESFDDNSPFKFEEINDDVFQINIGSPKTNGLSLFHFIENKVKVPYRYIKDFTDYYTDENGKKELKTYSMFVRNLDYQIITNDNVYNTELEQKNIRNKFEYNGIEIVSYKTKELCKIYEKDFRINRIPTGVKLTSLKNNG